MLHEILLSLSGHPSPLLDTSHPEHAQHTSRLSVAERSLLVQLAELARQHRRLLELVGRLARAHPSPICRAVGAHVARTHLHGFQQHVLAVEAAVLRRDAEFVGAHDVVPLTHVAGKFAPWRRRFDWLLGLVEYMGRGSGDGNEPPRMSDACTGSMVMARCRRDLKSGYADVQELARGATEAAERAWLKNLAAWVIYGKLPTREMGRDDFCVEQVPASDASLAEYKLNAALLPGFVTPHTASTIVFIGKSLNHIRARGPTTSATAMPTTSKQLQLLSQLTMPLQPLALSKAISQIHQLLSMTTLRSLLPLPKVIQMLRLLHAFFLQARGEFALALIHSADQLIATRYKRVHNAKHAMPSTSNITLKEGEVGSVLRRALASLSRSTETGVDADDSVLELACDLIYLTTQPRASSSKTQQDLPSFDTFLLSIPTRLNLNLLSPMDLFLSPSDIAMYSSISAYLLTIRRAHMRLTDTWKITPMRRVHPPPPGLPGGSTPSGKTRVERVRERGWQRDRMLRRTWATISAAVFFFAELEAWLFADVVHLAWGELMAWISQAEQETALPKATKGDAGTVTNTESDGTTASNVHAMGPAHLHATIAAEQHVLYDPTTLTQAHNLFLTNLSSNLLLTQRAFTTQLHTLCTDIDILSNLLHRLSALWTAHDLEEDEGVIDAFAGGEAEVEQVTTDLASIGQSVQRGVESCVTELAKIASLPAQVVDGDGVETAFEAMFIRSGFTTAEESCLHHITAAELTSHLAGDYTMDAKNRMLHSPLDSAGPRKSDDDQDNATTPIPIQARPFTPNQRPRLDRLLLKLDFGMHAATRHSTGDDLEDDV